LQLQVEEFKMGKSKKDISRELQRIKRKIEELEERARNDPLKRNPAVHQELEELKRKLVN
ncbi:MAG: hypothetical protein V1911_04200, partial [Candidatus Micrarchaeota archaeon]